MTQRPSTSRQSWRRRRLPTSAVVTGIAVFLATLLLLAWTLQQEQERHEAEVREAISSQGSELQARLGQALDRRIFVVQAIRGYALGTLQQQGAVDAASFDEFAGALVARARVPLRSVQLAPDAVVTLVHPLEGNEEAIGHDLLGDLARRDAVLAGIEDGTFVIAGPFELLQGGLGLVARAPIYLGQEEGLETFWGFATVVADYTPIIEEVGLDRPLPGVEFGLRGKDALGPSGDVFEGSADVFGDGLLYDIRLPTGSWQLGVRPAGGWAGLVSPNRAALTAGGLLLALLLAGLATWVVAGRRRASDLSQSLSAVIEAAPVPILATDAQGRVEAGNAAAFRAFDVGLGDALSGHAHIGSLFSGVLAGEEEVHASEVETVDRDGRVRMLVIDVVRRTDRVGGPVVVASDVTDRREVERIRVENRAILDAGRLKDEFLAGMSHELRTPLNGIIGLAQILEMGTAGELQGKQLEFVKQIHVSGNHLLSLINDVLDLAKIEADTVDLDLGRVDLDVVIAQAVDMVRSQADVKGISVDVRSQPDVVIRADDRRLRQVLLNLLGNAVKFTPAGGSIGIRGQMEGAEVRIDVWDTGIGIAPEHQHRLFKPFQQVRSSLDREHGGTGLGLSLSQRLVELQGGRIDFTSDVGKGSTFSVWFPARVDTGTRAAAVRPPDPSRQMESPLVVVAEDNDVNRMLLTEHLRARGWRIAEARNGLEAVEQVTSLRPDVVLMDVQMPGLDGLEATRRLKSAEATNPIPIVAITALAMRGDEERCLAAGCDAYVSKPVKLAQLDEVLARVVGRGVVEAS